MGKKENGGAKSTIRRRLSTRTSTTKNNSNAGTFYKLASILEQNKKLFRNRKSLPNIYVVIFFYIISIISIILILMSGETFADNLVDKIICALFILVIISYNIISNYLTYNVKDSEETVHNAVCVLRYNAEEVVFPNSVEVSYPQSGDFYPTYRSQTWQSVPAVLLVPGDIIDVTGREIPPWSKKLSPNSYRIYPRKGVAVNNSSITKSNSSSPMNTQTPPVQLDVKTRPVLCAVEQAPILIQNHAFNKKKSDVEKVDELFGIIYFIMFVILLMASFAFKESIHYCALLFLPSLIMLSPSKLWQLRRFAIKGINQFEDTESVSSEDDNESIDSFDSSDSSSFWAQPSINEDDVISDFYLPDRKAQIRSLSNDAPEQIAMFNSISFTNFHPSFFTSSTFIDSFIVFTDSIEVVDAKNSIGQVPDLRTPDLEKYSAQLGPLTFASLAGKADLSIFEPYVLEMPHSKWPKIIETLRLFGLSQHKEEEFDARRILSVYCEETNGIANAYLVHRSTESSIISKGSPSIIKGMCSKYWDGKELKDIDDKFEESVTIAIARATHVNDGCPVAFAQGMVDYDFKMKKQVKTPENIPEEAKNLTFLGIIIFSRKTSQGCEEFQENLAEMGIRMSIFSHLMPRESLSSIGNMGLSTDFNCVIDLDDYSPKDVYNKLDTLNTHMPVGVKELISYVEKYDSIPLTIPLYLHPTEESVSIVLTLREKKGQNVGIISDPLMIDGVALSSSYGFIAYDSISKRSTEDKTAASISIRAINEVTAMPAMAHLSEGTRIEVVSDLLKDSRNEESHMRQSLLSFFFSLSFILLSIICSVWIKINLFVVFLATIISSILSFLIMKTPHDQKLLRRHRLTKMFTVSQIVMNIINFVVSFGSLIVWVIIQKKKKQIKWYSILMFLILTSSSVALMNSHTAKIGFLSRNILLIASASTLSIISVIIHISLGIVEHNFDWLSLILAISSFAVSVLIDFVSKTMHNKAEEERQMLAEIDFATKLGAFSPDRR